MIFDSRLIVIMWYQWAGKFWNPEVLDRNPETGRKWTKKQTKKLDQKRIGTKFILENHDQLGLQLLKNMKIIECSIVRGSLVQVLNSKMGHCIIQLTVLLFQWYSLHHPNAFLGFPKIAVWLIISESSMNQKRASKMKTLLSFKSSILSDKQSLPFSNSTMHILPRH